MSSMIEDRRPFAAMQNYHLMDEDATASQAALNIPEDNGRKYRAERPGFFGINIRLLILVISIIFFILALILFIGTIVAYYTKPGTSSNVLCNTNNDKGPSFIPPSKHEAKTERPQKPDPDPDFESDRWSVTKLNGKHVRPGELVFQEEFSSFNTSAWFHFTGDSDNHFYFHVDNRSTSFVDDGRLYLKPIFAEDRFGRAYIENGTLLLGMMPSEKCKNESVLCWKGSNPIVHPIMAPMIVSKNFFKFTYGKLQIRAKMPSGDWIEPIISLQPEESFYGDDLVSGQIHFVDTRGNRKLFNMDNINIGSEQQCPDIRYGTKANKRILYYCINSDVDNGFDRDFHVYELEWTPTSITLKIDDEGVVGAPYPRPSMYKLWSKGSRMQNPWNPTAPGGSPAVAPFDTNFYLVMGLSIGGVNGFFSDEYINKPYPKPWNNTDPNAAKAFWDARHLWEPTWANNGSALQIDFIRLYALNETVSD